MIKDNGHHDGRRVVTVTCDTCRSVQLHFSDDTAWEMFKYLRKLGWGNTLDKQKCPACMAKKYNIKFRED